MARALCFKARDSYGMSKDSEAPAQFHYDRWLGPAPLRRTTRSAATTTGTGTGTPATATPATPARTSSTSRAGALPRTNTRSRSTRPAASTASARTRARRRPGKRVYGDVETYGHDKTSQETPNTQTATYTYADGTLLEMETRGRYTNHEGSAGQEVGNLFFGSDGWLEISGSTWKAFRRREREPFAGRRTAIARAATGPISSRRCARARTRRCTATSTRGISPPRCATWPTSRIASVAR